MKEFQKPCTEEVPTCGDTCEKPLECGIHKCVRRCHFGACEKVPLNFFIIIPNPFKFIKIKIKVSANSKQTMSLRPKRKVFTVLH